MTHAKQLVSAAASRNCQPIADILLGLLGDGARVLEIASGTGQHVCHFATQAPQVSWHPSDVDPRARLSIDAYCADLSNVSVARELSADGEDFGAQRLDGVICINMIHISPWSATEGLMRNTAAALRVGGFLLTYGPYNVGGKFTAASNAQFDASLRSRNPKWGIRDLADVTGAAAAQGLHLTARHPMPANNTTLVFEKR